MRRKKMDVGSIQVRRRFLLRASEKKRNESTESVFGIIEVAL